MGRSHQASGEPEAGQTVGADTLITFYKQRISRIKAPKSIDFVDAMPRGAVGKVMREEVRKRY
jgi:acyl-coenzyme A synthetase/AMP-(fatty) acid ligase